MAAVVGALLVVLMAELLLSARQLSRTADEGAHLYAGYQHWRAHDFGVNPEHPPLVKLVAAAPLLGLHLQQPHPPNPYFLAEENLGGAQLLQGNDEDSLLMLGRAAVVIFPLLLALLVFAAGAEMFGWPAGLMGMALFVFEPTVLAHGALITTDMGVTLFVFAAVYAMYRFGRQPGWIGLLGFAVATGLALASKMSGVIVLPIVLVCAGIDLLLEWDVRRAARMLGAIVFAALVGYGILWAFYGFRYTARPGALMIVPPLVPFASMLPDPIRSTILSLAHGHVLPEAYLYGWTKLPIDQMSHPMFLLGKVYPTGVWFYFPMALLIKTSLPLLLLLVLLPVFSVQGLRRYRRELIYLLVPVVLVLGTSMLSHLNIGVRHVLPVYPFLAVLGGASAWALARAWGFGRYAVAALLLFQAVSSMHAFPDYLAYANEGFGGSGKTYRLLSDSNVDWGQQLKEVSSYLRERHVTDCWFAYSLTSDAIPAKDGIPCKPLPTGFALWTGQPQATIPARISGTVLVSGMDASGAIWGGGDMNPYEQFQDGRPARLIGNSVLVYEGTYDVPLVAAQSHYSQVGALLRRGKADAALGEARTAVELAPDSAQVRAELGGTLLRLHRDAEAEAAFGEAMALAKAHRPDQSAQVTAHHLQAAASADVICCRANDASARGLVRRIAQQTHVARINDCGAGRDGYSVQRLKMREPLVPPKPKEFERA